MNLKSRVINEIISIEGGYSNDISDSGGETKFGITIAVAREYGYTGKMTDLPFDLAFEIYSKRYWDSLELDKISRIAPKVAERLCDIGVNMGITQAGRFLQRSLIAFGADIILDGNIGQKTINALEEYIKNRGLVGERVLIIAINSLQGHFYISLTEKREKDKKYIFGWLKNRIKYV